MDLAEQVRAQLRKQGYAFTPEDRDARLEGVRKCIEILESSPTWHKHRQGGELCWCETCAYVRGNATEMRALLPRDKQRPIDPEPKP